MHAAATQGLFADVELIGRPDTPFIDDLVTYWDRKRAGRIAPRRSDIDPAEIKVHLPHVFMVDVINGGDDFRYRLVGTGIVEALGRDSTGKCLSERYGDQPQARAQLKSIFTLVADRKVPIFTRGRLFWMPKARYRRFSGAVLPLSDDGTNVNILFAEMFVERDGKLE
jgi:hypothetical protein